MAKLIFLGERFAGRVYELTQDKITVGRGGQNTLALHDGSVSLSHCEILVNGPEVIVHDLGSANGTFVNGVRVRQQCQIKSGQTVRFGAVEARLELDLPQWEDTASEESAVFAARRWEQKQKQEKETPKPSTAPVTFKSDSDSDFDEIDATVCYPVMRLSPCETAGPPAPPVSTKPDPLIDGTSLAIYAVFVAGWIAVALWIFLSRK